MADYCFDTSAFINPWKKSHPPDVFPTLWRDLDELVSAGQIVAPENVLWELEAIQDDLLEWVKARRGLFRSLDDELQQESIRVINTGVGLVDPDELRSDADPFVIAHASLTGAAVVHDELPRGKKKRPKIPDICDLLHVRHIRIVDLMREQGWRY